jgi:hypothetical protein
VPRPQPRRSATLGLTIVDDLLVERVGALLTGYSDALLSCERLPRLGAVDVSYVTKPPDPGDQILTRTGTVTIPGIRALLDADAGRRTRNPATATVRASRTYARLYLHDHVFGQLTVIARILRFRAMSPDASPALRELANRTAECAAALDGWRSLRTRVVRLPVVVGGLSTINALAIAVVVRERSWGDARATVLNTALAVAVGFAVFAVLWLPSAQLGFRPKRAMLASGLYVRNFIELGGDTRLKVHSTVRFTSFPLANVYELEDAVFDALAMRKRREIPVDLVVRAAVFGVGVLALLTAAGLAATSKLTTDWRALVVAIPVALIVGMFMSAAASQSALTAIMELPAGWEQRKQEGAC